MNYHATNNIYQPEQQMCTLNQLCMISSARIQYNRLKQNRVSDSELEKAIYMIATELNHIVE